MMTHPLLPKLRELDLSGMVLTLDLRAAQATENHLLPTEFLALLLDDELERRSQERLVRRVAESGCDGQKTLAQFDFAAAPGVNRTLIQELATCAFVARHENVLLCGPTGVGKSHLANALAGEALKRDCRVLSRGTHHLLADLQAARATGAHTRLLRKVLSCDLLILDDFGLQPLGPPAVQELYDIIVERYERRSVIVTSNRAFEEWAAVFNNDLLASAALDRLTHHAHTLVIQGQSYRQRSRRADSISGSTGVRLSDRLPDHRGKEAFSMTTALPATSS
jgi:DNA replication protein DnaC